MDEREERARDAAVAWVDQRLSEAEQEEWDSATCFVALTTNDETRTIHVHGPFEDAADAGAYAVAHQDSLNEGLPAGEAPFVVTVYPVNAP